MTKAQVLKQTELLGRQFEVYGTPQEPLFLAKEVAEMIEHSDVSTMMRSVDEDEKLTQTLFVSGQHREMWLLTESGLYEVLMQSRKPIAKQFKKGVKAILRDIRTTGGYIATHSEETPEMIMARALEVAKATIERHQQRLQAAQQQNQALAQENEKLRKDSDYLNVILNSKKTVTVSQIAQDYGLSAIGLNSLLRDMRIQRKINGQWVLYAPFIEKGYVHSEAVNITRSNGQPDVKLNTRWTQRGRLFLYEELKKRNIIPLIER